MKKHAFIVHPINYSKGFTSAAAFQEWLLWIVYMAPYDVGIHD